MFKYKIIVCIIVCNLYSPAFAQFWANAGIPVQTSQIRTIAVDTVAGKLYAGGYIHVDQLGNTGLGVYDGSVWTVQDTIDNLVRALIMYNNELYMGGSFTTINSQPMPYLAKWDGSSWV